MTFDEAIEIIKDKELLHVKVIDSKGSKVMEFCDEQSAENTIAQLNRFKNVFSAYGALTFVCANDSIKKQNFKDAFKWLVTFSNTSVQPHVNVSGNVPSGYISQNEANLMAQLQALTTQMKFDAEMQKLREEMKEGKKDNGFMQYAPMLGLVMDLPPEKMQLLMAMGASHNTMHHHAPSINGLPTNEPTMAGTEQEKKLENSISGNVEKIAEKIGLEKVDELLKYLNDNPHMLDVAVNFVKK